MSTGRNHAVLNTPIRRGRLIRQKGDALCKPLAKFWGLESVLHDCDITCPVCLKRMQDYGITYGPCPDE
jgi:hypothetical protein